MKSYLKSLFEVGGRGDEKERPGLDLKSNNPNLKGGEQVFY